MSRRVFDLIRKLTCNRLDGEEGQLKITKDSKKSIEKYLKRKARSEEEVSIPTKNVGDILKIASRGGLSEEKTSGLMVHQLRQAWPGLRHHQCSCHEQQKLPEDLKKTEDHLGEVHGSINFVKHGLGFATTNVLAMSSKSCLKIGRRQKTILVSIHDAKGLLELLDGRLGEGLEDVGFLGHLEDLVVASKS